MKIVLYFLNIVIIFSQQFTGFVEYQLSGRLQRNDLISNKKDYVLDEARLQLKYNHSSDFGDLFFKSDFVYDQRNNASFFDLREAYIYSTMSDWLDLKIGRHIQTWGLGDLVFINDLFPKDWVSFFSGRQDDYLKAPSNAVRFIAYPDAIGIESIDISISPSFNADKEIGTENRFASINPLFERFRSNGINIGHLEKENAQSNYELSSRLKLKQSSGMNIAFYFYRGFYKSAQTLLQENTEFNFFHSRLNVYGLSFNRNLFGGILSTEYGYYYSLDDKDGENGLISNSSNRALILYESNLSENISLGFQFYIENIQDYELISKKMLDQNDLFSNFDLDAFKDENRILNTVRLTYKTMNETLRFTIFNFWSPTDKDLYFRPKIDYDYSDQIRFYLTANIFSGYGERIDDNKKLQGILENYNNSMFSQFQKDKNINITVRYIF
jgi:hypothetical protein